jgi:antitoxin component of MazEF toxin-antitoxin module
MPRSACEWRPASPSIRIVHDLGFLVPFLGVYFVYTEQEPPIMHKTLIRHGNSLALVIDKPILELLQITAETPLELTTNGDSILISPIRDERRQRRLKESLEKINDKFGDDLSRLAQ